MEPRVLQLSTRSELLLLFTDGAVEGNRVTVGAFLLDPRDGAQEFWGATVNSAYVESWKLPGQRQVISQAELLPVVVSKGIWAMRLRGSRVLCFVDNDGARAGLIAATMDHPASDALVLQARHQDLLLSAATWYERVPSAGNPGDAASRLEFERLVAWGAVEVRTGVPREYADVLEWQSHRLGCVR